MGHIEERLLRRFSGLRIMCGSAVIGLLGVAPLLLYIAFGPADGNPIGLGLLAVAAVPVAGVGLLVGFVSAIVQYARARRA